MSKNALEFPYRNVMLWVILHEVSVLVRIEESLTLGLCLRGLAKSRKRDRRPETKVTGIETPKEQAARLVTSTSILYGALCVHSTTKLHT